MFLLVITDFYESTRVDQNTGGTLLEFPVRTAMHRKSPISSAISMIVLSWMTPGIV